MSGALAEPAGTRAEGIVARGLRKRFGSVTALDGLDLTVSPGEIVALLGRNGAGKSTLLRILGTTVLPDGGDASVAGFDVVKRARYVRRSIGLVLGDERSWYWRLTGRANLTFFAAMQGLDREAARRRVDEVLAALQLEEFANLRFDGYSSGMRARLSIGRAILAQPPVLLLDEPTRALDPVVSAELRKLVCSIAKQQHLAVLWVTHNLHEACEIADRAALVVGGRIGAEQLNPGSSTELSEMFLDATHDDDASQAAG